MTSINYLTLLHTRRNVHTFNNLLKLYKEFNHDAILNLCIFSFTNKTTNTVRKLLDAIIKYVPNTQLLSFNDLHIIQEKLLQRKTRLKLENRSTQLIDLTYFKCFLNTNLAIIKYKEYCNTKTAGYRQYIKENPEILKNTSLEFQIKKHGEEIGSQKYNEYVQKQKIKSKRSIEYWMTICSTKEEALIKQSEAQTTFSLDKCILKYGEECGTEIFNKRQETWQNTLNSKSKEEIDNFNKLKGITLENMIRKYGLTEGTIKYNNWHATTGRTLKNYQVKYGEEIGSQKYDEYREIMANSHNCAVSKESLKFFVKLYKWLRKNQICKKSDVYWGIRGSKEYWLKHENDIRFYDFTIKNLNIIIEYNGIAFHAKHGDINWKSAFGVTYLESINNDCEKYKLAKSNNYEVHYVWSDDNLKNRLEELKPLIHESLITL